MPKVLRIINRFNLGGPTYNAAYLSKYMSPEFETLLVGGYKDETEEKSDFIVNNLGLSPIIIPEMRRSINPKNDIIAYKKLKKIISEFKPDIVHTHASKAGTLGRLAAYTSNVPVIVHTFHGHVFHSYFKSIKSNVFRRIEQGLAKLSTHIVAISDLQKQELSETYNITKADKISVIPLGFDLGKFQENVSKKRTAFRKEYNLDEDEIAIGIVGRIVPIKNHKLFIDAIKYVKENSNKKIRAFIVGDGECRDEIENRTKELNLDFINSSDSNKKATITFTSWQKEIDYIYSGIDIVALTSLNEGTPVSLIEAQAANKPIVSTNAGGIENTVIPNITALLSNLDNPQEYKELLLKVVDDDSLRASLSEKGWEHVKHKFHYTRLITDMSALYNNLLSS